MCAIYPEIGHASRVAVNPWCCQFSLQHGLAASVGIVLNKAECCLQSLGTPLTLRCVSSGES